MEQQKNVRLIERFVAFFFFFFKDQKTRDV